MHGARAAVPASAVEIVGIALPEMKALERQAKRIGCDLRKCRLMALAVGMRTDLEINMTILAE